MKDVTVLDENIKKEYSVTEKARACARTIAIKLINEEKSKTIDSYRTKMLSALRVDDFDKFTQFLLQLSNHTNEPVMFAIDLLEDFEKNKNSAYVFLAALDKNIYQKKKKGENLWKTP